MARLLHVGYHQQHGASATHVRVPSSSSSSSDPQQRGAGEPVAKFPVDGVPIQGHGGKALEDLAREGNPKAVPLAVPLRRSRKHVRMQCPFVAVASVDPPSPAPPCWCWCWWCGCVVIHQGLAFSYSGLKTSILYASQASDVLHRQTAADLAASFQVRRTSWAGPPYTPPDTTNNHMLTVQATATQHLVDRLRLAFALPELSGTKTLVLCCVYCWAGLVESLITQHMSTPQVLCGGVAANEYIRNKVQAVATQHGREFVAPAPQHCTDNGVMVAYAGLEHFELVRCCCCCCWGFVCPCLGARCGFT